MEKTFRQTESSKKEEGSRGKSPARAVKQPEKMNEMYEQCFPMELNIKP